MIRKSRGAALVIVLFIAAILASISVLLIVKTKQHIERITIAKEFMQAERQLISDLNHFIFATQTSPYSIIGDSSDVNFSKKELPIGINLQGIPFSYRTSEFSVQDMGGLVSFTPLDRDLMKQYLTQKQWPQDEIYRFLDVLEDWQDNDSFQRISGAESGKYMVNGYPLNQRLQSIKELALLANVNPLLLQSLATDKNLILYSAGRQTLDYAPDRLLPVLHSPYNAKLLQKARDKSRQEGTVLPISDYTSGNWIITVKTSVGLSKSSKMLHLLRRFGERRPFVITHWQERAK